MAELPDIFMPEWALGVMEMDNGKEIMVLELHTASIEIRAALCTKENYRVVADKIKESIMRVGAEMKSQSLITPVKELPDGLKKRAN